MLCGNFYLRADKRQEGEGQGRVGEEKKRTYRKNVYKSHNQKNQKKILSI